MAGKVELVCILDYPLSSKEAQWGGVFGEERNTHHGVGATSGARPQVAGAGLARAAAVGLADNAAAVAGGQDAAAVGAGLDEAGLAVAGQGGDADGEEGENGEDGELHFEGVGRNVKNVGEKSGSEGSGGELWMWM